MDDTPPPRGVRLWSCDIFLVAPLAARRNVSVRDNKSVGGPIDPPPAIHP